MSFSLTTAVIDAAQFALSNVHTCMPGQIQDYDYKTQLANIYPCINKQNANGTTDQMPLLFNCPVIFPKSGGASLTFPVKRGDPCLIVICERSIDNWYENGGFVDPQDPRKFDLSDAVAIMGLSPQNYPNSNGNPVKTTFSATNNEDVLLTYKTTEIRIKEDGSTIIKTPKVAIGNSTNELLSIISSLIALLKISPVTGGGPQAVPLYQALQDKIDAMTAAL
jgi:hypothetical protein